MQAKSILEVPALRAVAPLLLAAWDDAFLSPAELLTIRDALDQSAELDDAARTTLRAWLDPENPPSAADLRALERGVLKELPLADRAPGNENGATTLRQLFALLDPPFNALRRPPTAAGNWRSAAAQPTRPQPGAAGDELAALGDLPAWAPAIARWRSALEGPHAEAREAVRKLIDDARFRVPRQTEMAAYREQVLGWVRALSELPVIQRASETGGNELGEFLAAFETIALFDLSLVVKFGVQFGLFAGAIAQLGTAEHHKLLPGIARCELIGCFAMTERAHGSNVRAILTEARYQPASQEFEIHTPSLAAGKEWIGNAALHARVAVVFAQLETAGEQYGVHAFLVPIRNAAGELLPGVRAEDCGHKMGLNGVDNGRLWFDHVRVPRTALLDRFGQVAVDGSYKSPIPSPGKRFFTMLGTLVGGRINVAGGALAASKLGLTIALRYAAHRHQFPDPSGVEKRLIDYLTHRLRLMPALASSYAYSFGLQALLARIERAKQEPELGREIGTLAAGLKATGTWQAIDALQQARECCGGQGYLTSNRIDALRTDADVFATFEGDNTVLLQLVAKDLLRSYSRSLADSPLRSLARAAVSDLQTAITEKNPVATRRATPEALRDPEFQRSALQYRERSLLSSLARRIKRRSDDGLPVAEAFDACQDHAIALARAYVERNVLESFQEAAKGDAQLEALCALYGLDRIHADLAWFLENDYLAANKSRALRKQLIELVHELAPVALAFCEAFAIPDNCRGPLADPQYLVDTALAPLDSAKAPD